MILNIFEFIFGSLIGSFLNVVIIRLPLGKSIVSPRSSCGNCKKIIPWYHNIPLLSWITLRARCGQCKDPISSRYFLVELLTAVIAIFIFIFPYTPIQFLLFVVACVFVCHFFIDLDHQILPDSLNLILAICFFILGFEKKSLFHVISGGMLGLSIPLLITYAFYKLRGVVGLGGGDIKLWGALGLYLGMAGILMNIVLSCWIGALVGVILIATKKLKKENPFAFGPYIILASIIQIFFPQIFSHILYFFGYGSFAS